MTIVIEGEKYNFNVVLHREGGNYHYFLNATSKFTGRTSCINNLNAVLSEFGVDMDDPKVTGSPWLIAREEVQYYIDTATQFLFDRVFLDYLEERLDEDRMLGEWENFS